MPNKAEIRESIREVRRALREAEQAVDAGDWAKVIHAMYYWASPYAGQVGSDLADELGINLP